MKKRVVITGAASGIGRATAEAFAKKGDTLYLCDRDEDALARTASELGVAFHRVVDVSKRDAMQSFADAVHADGGAIDVLVNNAGVGLAGGVLETSLEDFEWVLSVNLWGVLHGVHAFVPQMVERRRGHVVNVASVLGLIAGPGTAGYSTSKFAVVGLSESMRADLAPHGVGVSVICPGAIDTNIVKTTRYRMKNADAARSRVIDLYKKRAAGPERVAQAIVRAVERGTDVVPVTPEAHLGWWLKRFVPGLAAPVARAMAKQAMGRTAR
ncbi:MAG TPA: SDR family NAD(P)-dependent oxidoreductase [Labilithrix sp.]|jgi:short-subunit dehydrogenase